MKLSGKTRSGWSLGVLHALTGQEEALLATGAGATSDQVVEPRAQYGMARVSRDFREGKSAVGMISTWTRRDPAAAGPLSLHSAAYTGGVDARHRFGDDRFIVSGYLLGSTVRGSADAIARTQRSPARYFQRPDATHTEYDPTRTSLGGWAGSATLAKISGGYWRFATGAMARSPGFDSNDLGFMREGDFIAPFVWVGYQHFRPTDHFQRWHVNFNAWTPYSFGGEAYSRGANVNASATLNNFWGGYFGVMRQSEGLSNTMLRGGPMLLRDPSWGGWYGFWSDSRKPLQVEVGNNWQLRRESGSWSYGADANLRWRPSPRATLSAGPFVNWRQEDLQWVGRFGAEVPNYVFAELSQTTVGITARADWTFSPNLSLQVYAQPFVSAADLRIVQAHHGLARDGLRGPVRQPGDRGRGRWNPPGRHRRRRRRRHLPQPGLQLQAVPLERGAALGIPARVRALPGVVAGARPLRPDRRLLLPQRPRHPSPPAWPGRAHAQAELLARID